MDLENLTPRNNLILDHQPVENCIELVEPLFDNTLVENEDLLVLCVTEGFQNFPLHAIETDVNEPLILHHQVVYVPSLSVLHKSYWTRHTSDRSPKNEPGEGLRSLVIGGIVSTEDAYQYGGKAVERIGNMIQSPETTFVGSAATLDSFRTHISSSDLLHIHLHTNYGTDKTSGRQGELSQVTEEEPIIHYVPARPGLVFNDSDKTENQLTASQIIEMNPARGAHLNLIACSSGRQGKFDVRTNLKLLDIVTNEVMGLVPAFLFSAWGA